MPSATCWFSKKAMVQKCGQLLVSLVALYQLFQVKGNGHWWQVLANAGQRVVSLVPPIGRWARKAPLTSMSNTLEEENVLSKACIWKLGETFLRGWAKKLLQWLYFNLDWFKFVFHIAQGCGHCTDEVGWAYDCVDVFQCVCVCVWLFVSHPCF